MASRPGRALDVIATGGYSERAMAQLRFPRPRSLPELRYVRAPEPIVFPEAEEVPEGLPHLLVRTFLFQLLRFALGPSHSVGSDQFIYLVSIATDPKRKVAPDVFVRLGVQQTSFGTWKTWENGGAPDLAVEIVSPNEGDGVSWDEKLARYHELGVSEVVRFDPEATEGKRLRVWDRVRGDLVERVIGDDRTPCLTLGLNWTVCAIEEHPVALRLIDDDGRWLESQAEVAAKARAEAEARIRDLEEQLRRVRGEAR